MTTVIFFFFLIRKQQNAYLGLENKKRKQTPWWHVCAPCITRGPCHLASFLISWRAICFHAQWEVSWNRSDTLESRLEPFVENIRKMQIPCLQNHEEPWKPLLACMFTAFLWCLQENMLEHWRSGKLSNYFKRCTTQLFSNLCLSWIPDRILLLNYCLSINRDTLLYFTQIITKCMLSQQWLK